ncbi:transporter substrate-binding domain-containing protein [Desulfatiferula olefinivorans]
MNPRYRLVLTVLWTLIVIWGPNPAVAGPLRLGYIEFPPFTYTDGHDTPAGIFIDLANHIFPDAGLSFTAESYPVRRLAEYIGSGDLDVWMGLKTLPEFEGKAFIGKTPIAALVLRAYTRGKKPPIRVKEDLIGKSIIVMRGYSYGGWITYIEDPANQINHIKANKHEAAFNMLRANRADYLLDYKEPSDMALQSVSIPDLSFNQISALPCYIVISRSTPDGQNILDRLEASYHKLRQAGVIADPQVAGE